ncbi:hypothetical protein N5F23_19360 [Pseudomonas sichuanensis]|uniref:imm11 family protein n=1 Tax=Pseudomonas sichuanensis TaxID=2213015 RepID=UPI00244CC101|nr:hypothetical protein [Pseudomonas sichuanensis]MDH0729908.1 hypothetical protein [Pseudomonas sichuanensis]MDH1584741.1 hypothetical protein [Pseudomonas sichuanensis]MDH1594004.1 hypothetical protein [Pseudomonas sichuanensis]MDH1600516.1 hypothetical protein [Pseudomonas sichuanensis]
MLYLMLQKSEPGCPTGELDAILYDQFYADPRAVEYGRFPWYSNAVRMRPHEKFPAGLVLIGKSSNYKFAARSIARDLYVVSSGFLEVCKELDVKLGDAVEIDVRNASGEIVVDEKYFLVTFESYLAKDVVLPESKITEGQYGRIEAFTSLVIDVQRVSHVFRVLGLSARFSTLFCSGAFKEKAERAELKGIEFIPLLGSCSDDVVAL